MQSFSSFLKTCPYHLNVCHCITVVMSSIHSLSLNSLHENLCLIHSAFFLPSVLWSWLGARKSIQSAKRWVMRCWCGNLSAVRCKWFAYGPADATATLSSLASLKFRWVNIAVAGLPMLLWKKEAIKWVHKCMRRYSILTPLSCCCLNQLKAFSLSASIRHVYHHVFFSKGALRIYLL